jgi:hypothetical protein
MLRVLGRLFRFSKPPQASARPAGGPQASRRCVELMLADFEARAKARRRRSSRQIIDLAYAKAVLGRDWERVAPRMGQLIGQILEQQLGLTECCFARDGDRYLILFERTSDREAQVKVAKIATIIARLLPGKKDGATERAAIHALAGGPVVRKNWFSRVLKRIGSVFHRRKSSVNRRDREVDEDGSAESRPPQAAASGPEPDEIRIPKSKPSTPAKRFAGEDASAPPRRAAAQPPPQPPPNAPRPRSKLAVAMRRSGAPREFPPAGLTFVYQPFWEVRSGRISTYISMPVCEGEDGILLGNEVLPLPAELRHVTQLDELALKHAIKDMGQSSTDGASLAIPVHFATLADVARRSSYLMQCSDLSDELRDRFILEIIDVPEETPKAVIEAVIAELDPFVRGVAIQLPVYQWDLRRWTDAGVIAVGVNRARNSMKETEFVAQFNRFSMLAADAGLKSYLQNAETLSLSVAAVGAGATFVSGTIVADFDLTKRFKIQPYGLAQLYEQPGLVPLSDLPPAAAAAG